jgi:enoyl-CoA hydratase/carnithine racemase
VTVTQTSTGTSFDVDRTDGVAVITFNRPQQLNTLSRQAVLGLCTALDDLDADDDVRAIVFTGTGRAFSAGADLSGGAGTFRDGRESATVDGDLMSRDFGGILALRLFACVKPLVAAINGDAVGLGVTMTLPMDVRIAADTARFGFVFTRRGIVPEACSSWFLPRVVGISQALEWTMSGRLVSAVEAHEAGLVRDLVPVDQVLPAALEHAKGLVEAGAPTSVAATRQMMWQGLTQGHPMEAHRVESDLVRRLGASPDAAEGIAAFMEKRPPRFPTKVSAGLEHFRAWWPTPKF